MIASSIAQSIRSNISNDILSFITILEKKIEGISCAKNICTILETNNDIPVYGGTDANIDYWGYEVNIRLPIFTIDGLKPLNTDVTHMEFSIKIIADSQKYEDDYIDPLKYLEFNIVIIGYHDGKEMIHSLHLDRHPDNSPSDDPHPKYHFQFGGRKLEEKVSDYGQGMFFGTPRMMHYPMDFILGMDFILSNYYSDIWNDVKENDHDYNTLIGKYQNIIMKPYFNSMAIHWLHGMRIPFQDREWNTQDICPQIVRKI